MAKPTTTDLIAAVRAHALANYRKGGWDYLVECWEDKDIADEIDGCTSKAAAIKRCKSICDVMGDMREDAINA
jgi:hypothetical protein